MKNLVISAILIMVFATMQSCQKEDQEDLIILPESNSSELKTTIVAYDNFDDGMNWNFTNVEPCPCSPGSYELCGYSSNSRWAKVSWNGLGWWCALYPTLATCSGGTITLQVPANQLKGAQVESLRSDYWYGSYRVKMRAGEHGWSVPVNKGSVSAFFFKNPSNSQEIDIEICTNEHLQKLVHFVTHPGNYTIIGSLPSDPTTNYIEYGFDWYAGKIDFFINGVKISQSQYNAVPTLPGKILMNHWTGNANYGGCTPNETANMKVDYAKHVPFLLVTYPDAPGIIWTKGSTRTIKWNKCGDVSAYTVKLQLYKNGYLYQTIASGVPNTGSYTWTIPSSIPSSNTYQIRVQSSLNSNYFDYSNNAYTIQ